MFIHFCCLCPLGLATKLNFNISKVVYSSIRSDERLKLERQLFNSLRWPIYNFNLVDITKLPCYPHRRSTTVFLETFTLNPWSIQFVFFDVSAAKDEVTHEWFCELLLRDIPGDIAQENLNEMYQQNSKTTITNNT